MVQVVVSGERAVAPGPTNTVLAQAEKGGPVRVVYPTNGSVLVTAPTAILKGARHSKASKLFLDFLTSRDASRLSVGVWGDSLHDDVPPRAGAESLADIPLLQPTTAELIERLPALREEWRQVFGA